VTATIDPAIKEDQVRATVTLKDGRTLEKFASVVGGIAADERRSRSEVRGLADGVLPSAQATR
jgi:hypothetical protein